MLACEEGGWSLFPVRIRYPGNCFSGDVQSANVARVRVAQPDEEGLLRRSEMFFLSCQLCPEEDEESREAGVLSGESCNVLTLDALLRTYGREPPGGPPWQGEESLVIRVPI